MKLVSSLSVPFGSPDLQQMPKEKETQDQTIFTQRVFADGDAPDYLQTTPRVVIQSQLRIIFDPENGNRDDHIGASLHQPCQRSFEIRFCKNDQHHDLSGRSSRGPLLPGSYTAVVRGANTALGMVWSKCTTCSEQRQLQFSDKFGHENCVILRNSCKAASCAFGSYHATL